MIPINSRATNFETQSFITLPSSGDHPTLHFLVHSLHSTFVLQLPSNVGFARQLEHKGLLQVKKIYCIFQDLQDQLYSTQMMDWI